MAANAAGSAKVIGAFYVRAASQDMQGRAELVAAAIGCPLRSVPGDLGHGLLVTRSGLGLEIPGFPKPLVIDALSHDIRRRAQARRGLHLIRACGGTIAALRIIDATAGLGRDAFTLAWAGAQVDMIERDVALAYLLRNALDELRSAATKEAAALQMRLTLREGDACALLAQVHDDHDVIYLDPMFGDGARGKSQRGLPQREMQMLGALDQRAFDHGDDYVSNHGSNGDALLAVALALRPRRIVVKRGIRQAPLCAGHAQPHHAIVGKRVRFDVYQFSGAPAGQFTSNCAGPVD